MGSITRKRESPQLAFCLLSVALKARTCESEKDISGFRADSFYPPTQPLFTPTLPPTQKWDTLLFCGTTEDHPYSKKPTPGREVGLQESLRDLLNTERVGFEPTEGFPSNDFESFAFDHSATSPAASRALRTLRIDHPRTAWRDPLGPLAAQVSGQPEGMAPLNHIRSAPSRCSWVRSRCEGRKPSHRPSKPPRPGP